MSLSNLGMISLSCFIEQRVALLDLNYLFEVILQNIAYTNQSLIG